MKKNIFTIIALVLAIVALGTSCIKEKETKIIHIYHDSGEDDYHDSGEDDAIVEEIIEEPEFDNPASYSASDPVPVHTQRPTYSTTVPGYDESEYIDDKPVKCQYCNGTGQSYLGQQTPLMERNIMDPEQYICKVCEGKKNIKPSLAKERVRLLEDFYGPNWFFVP